MTLLKRFYKNDDNDDRSFDNTDDGRQAVAQVAATENSAEDKFMRDRMRHEAENSMVVPSTCAHPYTHMENHDYSLVVYDRFYSFCYGDSSRFADAQESGFVW
uniref:Uncharacterized protein n=1 Tax=Aureoumbra lagunensis TaxID=44058 RepID=A0A7S3JXI4_9STRA|mmetsp:Transcript_5866/g.8324  ORF Transcript_5866/g.8324 Transcript_5866/m.8324 type:complete len:103 (+) Transcript_5866:129-437(+)|eukprot:CAMPEP_0197289672 /NCGR_PEP_ID=MMETSP0890-20130614/6935_1 /TAXON_ID=44058 ORGANISM="Aureoumbra lagunensis, Strain CCMP1510" /NCGR_SAMPLE_ID=MMETSP0890 /ASSEMBLY_ACC=CAM_ASM_000533 /LENGTH=102 /DNA_ID=CAMNT_0042761225 /DNA_START=77 /DNA_END=385 /DNA_ORIENTATION=-